MFLREPESAYDHLKNEYWYPDHLFFIVDGKY